MAAPITPEEAKALIPNPNGGPCDEFNKSLLQVPEAFWKLIAYMFNEDRTINETFATDMCTALGLIGCAGGTPTVTSTGTGSTTGGPTTDPADAIVFAVTDQNKFLTVNLATGAVTVIKTGTSLFYGLAQDPTDGTLYGYVLNGSDIDFVSVNPVTGNETVLGAAVSGFSSAPTGLTFKSDGTLYCEIGTTPTSCATNGALKTVNKANGALSAVGGQTSRFLGDICFGNSGTLFAVGQEACFVESRLFSVNVSTAAVTTIALLSPFETAGATSAEDCLAYVNGILYKTRINQIAQINTGTGHVTHVADYDNSTNGRIKGMAKNQ